MITGIYLSTVGRHYSLAYRKPYSHSLISVGRSLPVFSVSYSIEYGSMLSKGLLDRIVHCIYSHHGRKEWGAPCDPATIEAIILSQLDQLAAWGQSVFSVPNLEFCQALSRRVVNTPCPEE